MPDEEQATRGPAAPRRLLDSLDRVRRGRLAVVCAPAGHGKRDLVAQWLDEHPELARHWLAAPDDLDQVRTILDGLDPGTLLVVVARGRQQLRDAELVARLLELAERDNRVRVVFVGRVRPEAPLGSLAARGLMIELDGQQLAWTRQEMAEALAVHTPGLPGADLDAIMQAMGGWPAIARMLCSERLTASHLAKVTRLADSYIAEEVLAGLGTQEVRLLTELSALPALDPLAAAWMTGRGDAAAQLSRLQAHGVPISWDEGNVIRLNPMLRAHLTRALALSDPSLSTELNQRAALWLRNRGRPLEAVRLAMEVSLPELAWMLTGEFITVTMHLPALVKQLPELVELLPPGWEVETVRSLGRGLAMPQTMIAQLGAIDPQLMVQRSDTGRFGYALMVLGMVRNIGYETDEDISLALEIASASDSRGVHELDLAILAGVRAEYGLYLLHQGRLPEAEQVLMGALGMARVASAHWLITLTLSALAFVTAERGDVQGARRLADEALLTTSEHPFTTDALDEYALLALALVAVDTGELSSARRWLDQIERHKDHLSENEALRLHVAAALETSLDRGATALRMVAAHRDQRGGAATPFHELALSLAAFNAAIQQGDTATARAEQARLSRIPLPDLQAGNVVLEARLALAEGDPRTAYLLLEPLAAGQPVGTVHPKHMLHLLMTLGVAADELHRPDEALRTFQRAGVLADRLGLNTPRARHTTVAADSRKEVPLTEAERNVLAQLDPARTLAETAEALFISQNTLKTHLRRIYRKLGVGNREEAIERARVMGIRPLAPQ